MNSTELYETIANAIYSLSAMEQSTLLDFLQQQVKSNMAENDYDAPEKEVVVEEEDYFLLHHANADCSHYEGLGEAIEKNAENIIAPMIALSAQRRNKVVEDLAVHFGHSVRWFKSWVYMTEGKVLGTIDCLNNMKGIDAYSYNLNLKKTYEVLFKDRHYHELTIELLQERLDFYHFVSALLDRLRPIANCRVVGRPDPTEEEINAMIEEVRALDCSKWELLVETTSPFIDMCVEEGERSREKNPLVECCVCYDETRATTECGHPVCHSCWGNIVKSTLPFCLQNHKCPMCRAENINVCGNR